jgi:CBS domain-containing protein
MDVMAAHHVRRLAVLGEDGRVVGWITLADLARHLLVESGPLQAALRAVTEAPE